MTTKEFVVEGMTCNGCVASVQKKLAAVEGVESALVTLSPPLASVVSQGVIDLDTLQEATGKYTLTPQITDELVEVKSEELAEKSFATYKPLILIVAFILGVSLFAQFPWQSFDGMLLMRHFMAGFFIVFSFFKLLNLSGFASSYSMYDIVAKKWNGWGFIYPFVELGLGILYLTNSFPFATNLITVVVLSVSAIGVIESNINKRKIKCACLGDVFNLPMSTVTIVEDVTMVAMAAVMLFVG